MTPKMRTRGRLEAIAACVSGVLFLVTLVWPDWIERAFGVDPDAHGGTVEWAVVALALCATIVYSLLARGAYRRARALSPK
ncbi:ABC transporter permease [Streptomyces sp. NPDC052107]|uniref:ABC transporter permease n=1 Tax=Streptomyces sp. NPDC052107 TaxID=3155632 RepID=UPI00341CDD08